MKELKKKDFCIVTIGKINDYKDNVILPFFVKQDLKSVTSVKVIDQKKASYGLLHIALLKFFDYYDDFSAITKSNNGKPISEDYCFSISHSKELVAVAISNKNVGIDIESLDKKINIESFKKRILHENERGTNFFSKEDILTFWVKKEAKFKLDGAKTFVPKNIDTNTFDSSIDLIEVDSKKYYICVVTENKNVLKEFKFM